MLAVRTAPAALERAGVDVKALTLYQPWASAIAFGAKSIETRSWRTDYRGPIAIHAAARRPEDLADYHGRAFAARELERRAGRISALPLRAFVAVAELVDVIPTHLLNPEPLEAAFGDFDPGRYGWILADVRRLPEPVPYQGARGLWEVPTAVRIELVQ